MIKEICSQTTARIFAVTVFTRFKTLAQFTNKKPPSSYDVEGEERYNPAKDRERLVSLGKILSGTYYPCDLVHLVDMP
jgi:hypothetical protein